MGRKKGHRQQSTESLRLACYKASGSSVLQEGGAATRLSIWDALEGSVSETTKSRAQNVTRASACSATAPTRKEASPCNLTLLGEKHKTTRCSTDGSLLKLQDKHTHPPEAGPVMHLLENLNF